MPQSPSTSAADRDPSQQARRRTVLRSLLLRALAVLVLVVFVVALGDYRRKHIGLGQAQRYADALRDRIGDSASLPLNLAPESFEDLLPSGVSLETLNRDEVRTLRERREAFIVAWSVKLIQVLNRNGRAIVIFDQGELTTQWITDEEFQSRMVTQRAVASAARDLP